MSTYLWPSSRCRTVLHIARHLHAVYVLWFRFIVSNSHGERDQLRYSMLLSSIFSPSKCLVSSTVHALALPCGDFSLSMSGSSEVHKNIVITLFIRHSNLNFT